MDESRFHATSEVGRSMLATMVMSSYLPPVKAALGGEVITYNAYYHGQEVVVLGVQMPDGPGHTVTKPVAILVDEEVFQALRVDEESGRYENGDPAPPKVV